MSAARQVLLDLADRCEREEPSRSLDGWIYRARHNIEPWRNGPTCLGHVEVDGGVVSVPAYTTSLDAAVMLVPAGWASRMGSFEKHHWAELNQPMHGWTIESDKKAKTLPLALCAASLRARAETL